MLFDKGSDGNVVSREFTFRKLQPAVNFLVPHRTENSKLKVNPQLSKTDSSGVCEGSRRRRRRGYFLYLSFYYLALLFLKITLLRTLVQASSLHKNSSTSGNQIFE